MRTLNAVRLYLTVCVCQVSLVSANAQLPQCSDQGKWSEQSFVPGSVVQLSTPLLLTDGRVMAQYVTGASSGNPWQDWYALIPSRTGCYSLNATDCPGGQPASWSQLATLADFAPAAFASAVLPDGKVILEGGEFDQGMPADIYVGALYDPTNNTWTDIAPPTGWWIIGDAPSVVLADGTFMLGNACGNYGGTGQTALFDEKTLSWNSMPQPPEWTSEASFTLLPDDDVLFVGTCWPGQAADNTCTTVSNRRNSEIYNPALNEWTSGGNTPDKLYAYGNGFQESNSCSLDSPVFGEQGPAALLPTGLYFATGGFVQSANTVYTALYDPITEKWTATPDMPKVTVGTSTYTLSPEDEGSVVLPDGNYLIGTQARDNSGYLANNGVYYIEWNGSSYCQLTNLPDGIPSAPEMLTLPTGQILVMQVSWGWVYNYFIYTPKGTSFPGIEPQIVNPPATLYLGHTYEIKGRRFNGATQSSFFGDDFQNATNYPLVRIAIGSDVYYLKTHNPSTMGVATGLKIVSTSFDVPSVLPTGTGLLEVVTNGIPSKPVEVEVKHPL